MTRRASWRVAAALVAGVVALGACGDDDGDDGATEPDPTEATNGTGENGEDGDTVEVTALDYAYSGIPDTVPAGTRLTLVNESTEEVHELVAIPLPDDETRPLSELVTLPPEELEAVGAGEPATVLIAPPGSPGFIAPPFAAGDGVLSEPGRYALMCFIEVGTDPDAWLEAAQTSDGPPDVGGSGPPHFVEGMWHELTVE